MRFDPESFWYIKLRDYGDRGERKMPLEQWGGYDTDFSKNDNVYTHKQTVESDHGNWAIIGQHETDTKQLVVIDIDAHKIDDFDASELKRPHEDVTIVKSIRPDRDVPGFHLYVLLDDTDVSVKGVKPWIDIKANAKGHVVSPFHNEQYEHVHGDELISFPNITELNRYFEYKGEKLLTTSDSYVGEYEGEWEPLDKPPEDIPHCLARSLQARKSIPRDGSHPNPWKVDSAAGRRLVALGYSKPEAMSLLKEYAPRDGWDEGETSYQLDMLYRKQLTPESPKSLRQLGVFDDDDACNCDVCSRYDVNQSDIIDDVLPDRIYTDLAAAGLDADTHATVQGTARSGKTHGLTTRACEAWDGERIVALSPTHEEAKAWVRKWRDHGVDPAYIVGEQHARENYDIDTSGSFDSTVDAITPEQASRLEGINAYHSYLSAATEEDVIVTVPEMLHKVDDYDWLIATEEAAIKRMMSSPVPVMLIQKYHSGWKETDRYIDEAIPGRDVQHVIDDIESLQQRDSVHDAILEAARCIDDIADIVSDWVPDDWEKVTASWMQLVSDVERRLEQMHDVPKPPLEDVFIRLQNYNRVEEPILNTLYYDGTLQYGNEEDDRKQMFYVGDPDQLYVPVEDDVTVWLAGNSIPTMSHFHDVVHGDAPEPIGYKNDYEPLRKALDDNIVVKYTGRENQNQQSHDIQKTIEQIQQLSRESPSSLLVSGSSEYTARHAERIKQTTTPTGNDDLETIRHTYLEKANMCVAIAENSQWSEGVDMPEAQMGAIYNGHFAAPFEEYIMETRGDSTLLKAERIRAAQNATLRPSNIPSRTDGVIGTGKTPLLVPSYHVPDEIFELFDAYGIHIYETGDIAELRRLLIHVLDLDKAEEWKGDIVHKDDIPARIKQFRELTSSSDSSAD